MAEGASPDGATHVACVAKLSDDSMIMVDTTKQVGHSGFLSKPFHLKVEFRLVGTFWELKNKSNPLGLHQVVQTITADGLIALLDVNRAMELAMKGDLAGAKHYCVKALAFTKREITDLRWSTTAKVVYMANRAAMATQLASFLTRLRVTRRLPSPTRIEAGVMTSSGKTDLAICRFHQGPFFEPEADTCPCVSRPM